MYYLNKDLGKLINRNINDNRIKELIFKYYINRIDLSYIIYFCVIFLCYLTFIF